MLKNLPILIDFDGVLNLDGKPPIDAEYFLEYIIKNKIPSYIISNSTLKTGKDVQTYLKDFALPCSIPCMTTVDATVQYLNKNKLKASVYCDEKIKRYFNKFISDNNPDAVVIGDIGNKWSYKILNEIFIKVLNDADIIAMQMNNYWVKNNEYLLDAGSFITAIEYATSKKAKLIGKPSSVYFNTALNNLDWNLKKGFIMIGDDINSDIVGAQELGGKGILIYTGRTTKEQSKKSAIKPYKEVENLSEIVDFLSLTF
ncbi:MAG: hypothetical protein COW08_01320 [Ignavibacteriales bacterium CG12_big_fil_rev_8_21_14_0_65_30_8]|nr:MAG: hypothetical protein COW08_01320 [Ignavibacteriales bacterium CG12_big_fil_rev_8_21_14_0_65_30_8]